MASKVLDIWCRVGAIFAEIKGEKVPIMPVINFVEPANVRGVDYTKNTLYIKWDGTTILVHDVRTPQFPIIRHIPPTEQARAFEGLRKQFGGWFFCIHDSMEDAAATHPIARVEYLVGNNGKVHKLPKPVLYEMENVYRLHEAQQINVTPDAFMARFQAMIDDTDTTYNPIHLRRLKTEDAHEGAIKNFFDMQASTIRAVMNEDYEVIKTNNPNIPPKNEYIRHITAWLREARLFEIHHNSFKKLYEALDRYVTEDVGRVPWVKPGSPVNPRDTKKMMSNLHRSVGKISYPENLPFSVNYFALGVGVHHYAIREYFALQFNEKIDEAWLFAVLVMPDSAYLLYWIYSGEKFTIWTVPVYQDGSWVGIAASMTLGPWIVMALVDNVNEHQSLVVQHTRTIKDKLFVNKYNKHYHRKMVPPPFYKVRLHDTYVTETKQRFAKIRRKRTLSYRFDVRGHWRSYKPKRGFLPVPEKTAVWFKRNNWKVLTGMAAIDAADMAHLIRRRESPPVVGEWVAIRYWWVKDFEKGPDDAPKPLAVRLPTKGLLGQRN